VNFNRRERERENVSVPQPVSPTMRVTRFSRIFSTIFSLIAITGRDENLEDENGVECDELHDEVGDAIATNAISLSLAMLLERIKRKEVEM